MFQSLANNAILRKTGLGEFGGITTSAREY